MRALVTGGNGFIGEHLCLALRDAAADVVVAGRARDGGGVDLTLDLADAGSIRRAVESAEPDVIFHLAAQTFVPDSIRAPLETFDLNALGTARLYEALRAREDRMIRVVLASSAEVYGRRQPEEYPVLETLALRPASPYAASKAAAEAIALAAWQTYGVPTVIARGFNTIGPGQDARFAVPAFASQLAAIAAGGPPAMKVGNLEAERDFLDVRDVAQAYVALAEHGRPGEFYNICSGRAVALTEILRMLVAIAEVAVEVHEDPERMRPSDVPISYGDPSKLRAETGWTPRYELETSLRDVYADAQARVAAA